MSFTQNGLLHLVRFVFPIEVPGEFDPLSFHKLCVHMHVNKTKFQRNTSLELACVAGVKREGGICIRVFRFSGSFAKVELASFK